LSYMVNNIHLFPFLSDIHNRDIRQRSNLNLYQPSAQRAYLKGTYYMSTVVFNNLPVSIKRIYDNPTAFKRALKIFYVITLSILQINI
jgi:hypothetical protein